MLDMYCILATFLTILHVENSDAIRIFKTMASCDAWLKDETMRLVLLFVCDVMNMEV